MKPPAILNHLPDLCLIGCIGLVLASIHLYPAATLFPPVIQGVGWIVGIIGGSMVVLTLWQLRKRRTSTNPVDAPSCLLTDGMFAISRNPLYVGYVVIVLGCALGSASYLALIFPVLCFGVLQTVIIPLEEAMLLKQFGTTYQSYQRTVRRWL